MQSVGLHDSEGGSPLVELCDGAKDDRECVATAERAGKDVSGNGESGKDSTSKVYVTIQSFDRIVPSSQLGCISCHFSSCLVSDLIEGRYYIYIYIHV